MQQWLDDNEGKQNEINQGRYTYTHLHREREREREAHT